MDGEADESLNRVWKEFGKQTQAGKLLYDLYGVRFRPDKFVNYPQLKIKPKETKVEKERPKSKIRNAVKKIDYPDLTAYKPTFKLNKVDLIPKRRKEAAIKVELECIKESMTRASTVKKANTNRKAQIETLQDKFMFQERTVMPKGARLPGVNPVVPQTEQREVITILTKKDELHYLYSQIIKEIDERYAHMAEMKQLGNNKDQILMGEIKDRIDELKKIKRMIDEENKKSC